MDNSEVYIKMCNCPEIQSQRDGEGQDEGDVFSDNSGQLYIPGYYFEDWERQRKAHPIWLPRQDQLQEMIGSPLNPYPIIKTFADYSLDGKRLDGTEWIMLSMEQCWLAFVMHDKYGKRWDGENWVSGIKR